LVDALVTDRKMYIFRYLPGLHLVIIVRSKAGFIFAEVLSAGHKLSSIT